MVHGIFVSLQGEVSSQLGSRVYYLSVKHEDEERQI